MLPDQLHRRATTVALLLLATAVAQVSAGTGPPGTGPAGAPGGRGASAATYYLFDPDGNALAGVSVTLVGRSGSAATGDDGRFVLDPAPTPPFRLVVFGATGAMIGSVTVDGTEGGSLVLVPASVETVQVAIGIAPTTLAPPAAAPTVVSREENEQRNPARLVDTLAEVPGAGQSGSGATAVPTLRGLAQGRSLILIDDARVTVERRAGASATFQNPLALENVEVVRGPGSVAYGSDAIGGIIHARSPLPDPTGSSGRFHVGAGTGVDYGSAALEGNVPLGTSALLVQAHGRDYDDYEAPDGTTVNAGFRSAGMLLRGLVPLGGGRMIAGLQVDRGRDIGRPATDTERRLTTQPEENSDRLTVGWERQDWGVFSSLEAQGFLGAYGVVTEREDFQDETLSRAEVDAKDASLRFVGSLAVGSGTLRVGADLLSRFDLHSRDALWDLSASDPPAVVFDEVTIDDANSLGLGLFAEGEWRVGSRVLLAGGLRGDHVRTENQGGTFGDLSTSEGAPSGFASVSWKPGSKGLEVSLQVARGFRAPRLSDLYFQGTTARGRIVGNPDLVPETSRQLDLAVRAGLGKTKVAAYAYLYRIDDLIERYLVDPDARVFGFRNRGEEQIVGFELETDIEIAKRWSGRATVGFVQGRFLDDTAGPTESPYPDDVPPPTVTFSVVNRATTRLWWRAGVSLVGRDERPGPTEIETPGYALLDVSAGFAFSRWGELRLALKNVTNKSYPSSSDDRAPPAPGRNAALILAGRF